MSRGIERENWELGIMYHDNKVNKGFRNVGSEYVEEF